MAFNYDPLTARGQVRLLAFDFDAAHATFQDAEIDAFLAMNASDVRLSAAQALDVQAAKAAIVQGSVNFAGVSMNGSAVAKTLQDAAAELRRQVYDGDADTDGAFTWAEMVLDPFSYRERLVDQMLRSSS